ncbi:hypothetical protein ACFX2J_023242 [Malus domestica]
MRRERVHQGNRQHLPERSLSTRRRRSVYSCQRRRQSRKRSFGNFQASRGEDPTWHRGQIWLVHLGRFLSYRAPSRRHRRREEARGRRVPSRPRLARRRVAVHRPRL